MCFFSIGFFDGFISGCDNDVWDIDDGSYILVYKRVGIIFGLVLKYSFKMFYGNFIFVIIVVVVVCDVNKSFFSNNVFVLVFVIDMFIEYSFCILEYCRDFGKVSRFKGYLVVIVMIVGVLFKIIVNYEVLVVVF